MNTELIKEIIRNIDIILAPSLMSGNFPFDKNSIQRKTLTKGYLKFHIFQNKLFSTMSSRSPSSECKGIIIGSLSKIYRKKNGEMGDHSNLFLKNYLNRNKIKTAEILIPNLRDIILFKYLFKVNPLAQNNSFILSYFKQHQGFNINKLDLQNKLLDKIKKIRKSEEIDTSWQSSKNLDFVEKNIERYVNFIGSKEFIGYLSTIALSLENLFRTIKPKFIIANSLSGTRDRLAIFIAHRNNIKVLFVPHGVGGSSAIPRYIKEDDIPVDAYASAIYSTKEKRKICEQKEVWHLGPLWLGYLLDARKNILRPGIKNKFCVLYASQPLAKDRCITKREYYNFLVEIFKTFKELSMVADIEWIIKLHPRDDIRFYKRILREIDLRVKFIRNPSTVCIEDLEKLNLDIMISGYSTFALEMIISGKMVMGLLPRTFKESFFSKYNKSVIPLYTELYTESNLRDFKILFLEFLYDRKRREEKISRQAMLMREKGVWLDENSLESFLEFLNDFIYRE